MPRIFYACELLLTACVCVFVCESVSVSVSVCACAGLGLFQLLSAVDRAGPEPIRKRRSSLSHLIDQASEDDDCEPELPFVTVHGRMWV